jgi:RND superfamily putative drug exporter
VLANLGSSRGSAPAARYGVAWKTRVASLLLIPAAMGLLGERNWYLPSWLSWLLDLQVEGQQPPTPPANVPSDDAPKVPLAPCPSAPDRHQSDLTR